jgi:hypothetical protein
VPGCNLLIAAILYRSCCSYLNEVANEKNTLKTFWISRQCGTSMPLQLFFEQSFAQPSPTYLQTCMCINTGTDMSRAQLSLIPMALSIGHGCGASDSGNRCSEPPRIHWSWRWLTAEMYPSGKFVDSSSVTLRFKFLFPASATASPMNLQVMGRLWCPRTIMPGWMDAQPHTWDANQTILEQDAHTWYNSVTRDLPQHVLSWKA